MSLNLINGDFTPHIRWMATTSTWKKSGDNGRFIRDGIIGRNHSDVIQANIGNDRHISSIYNMLHDDAWSKPAEAKGDFGVGDGGLEHTVLYSG